MDIYQPQLQNPFGYDNLNDRAKYLHSALYRLMHRRGANYCARVDPEPDPEF